MIDQARFEDLRETMGADFAVLLAQSIVDIGTLSSELAGAACAGEAARGAEALHALKGVALNLGLDPLAEACLAAEPDAAGTLDAARVHDVQAAIACSLRALRRQADAAVT